MMAPQFVAPCCKGQKNDRNDAEAICEAAGRPNMRFVPIKNEEQQSVLTVHRARALLVGERTALVNQVRGFLTEYGIVLPVGRSQIRSQLPRILEDAENALPHLAREVFADQYARLCVLDRVIGEYDRKISAMAIHNIVENAVQGYGISVGKSVRVKGESNKNGVIRKAIKKRKLFPTDDSAKKVVYLAIMDASKKWMMPIRNWKAALNRLIIEFEDRLVDYI